MNSEEELFLQFKHRSVELGQDIDSTYFSIDVAEEILEKCKELSLAVIGLEGFILESGYIISQIDAIADFSTSDKNDWASYVRKTNSLAKNVLNDWRSRRNLAVGFTLDAKT